MLVTFTNTLLNLILTIQSSDLNYRPQVESLLSRR